MDAQSPVDGSAAMADMARIARLLQFADSTLPVGAFAFSNGLESAIQTGVVHDPKSLAAFVALVLRQSARMDGIAHLHGHRAARADRYEGVLAADACAEAGLELIPLPDGIRKAIDERVPARWSRNNPIDLAGGETRDTIPEVLDLVCAHPEVDAVIHLGIGIQAATAGLFRSGRYFPDHGLERMAEFHERQDRRYVEAGIEASRKHGKPVLAVTELVASNPENAGPAALKESGRLCYPSAHRAVRALSALVRWSETRRA